MSTAPRRSGWSCSRTRRTTIPPRSSPSAARPPAWAAPSAIRFPGAPTSTRPCASPAAAIPAGRWPTPCRASCRSARSPPRRPHGYSSYGNQIGLATGQVSEIYHPGYVAKRMEIGAVIGAAPRSNVVRREPRSPATWCCWWAAAPAATASAAPPAPPRPTASSRCWHAAPRCRRATRPPSASCSGCSATRAPAG